MLHEARAAGLRIRREGEALIVRGDEGQGNRARELLAHKPLVLEALEHEDEYRGHELSQHDGEHVDWREGSKGHLVCSSCEPPLVQDSDLDGVMQAVAASEEAAAASVADGQASSACPTCGSTGRCEGRLATTGGGWVCRHALAADRLSANGEHTWIRLGSRPEAGS